MFRSILADIRFSVRGLSARPYFVVVVVLTLALGIGANVAIFSLAEQILLRPMPAVPEPDRLVNLTDPGPDLPGAASLSLSGWADSIFSYPMFRDIEREQQSFVGIAAHRFFEGATVSSGEGARLETAALVSGSYFSVLGLQPALGRLLGPQDDRIDGEAESVVVSHAYWQRELGGDPGIVGRQLSVNGKPLTIVGVAPHKFHGTTMGTRASVFVPITFNWLNDPTASMPNHGDRNSLWLYIFARLAPGVEREEAESAVDSWYRAIVNDVEAPLHATADEQRLAEFRAKSLVLESGARGQSLLFANLRERVERLFIVSGLVLLLCGANVAGLMLVRGAARTGEIAVRASMGATRGRLASLLLVDSLLLALPAAVLSLPVAAWTLRGIANGRTGIPAAAFDVGVNTSAAVVAIGVAIASAAAFGLLPARGIVGTDPARILQAYGVRQTHAKAVARFRTALATGQIALSMTLLALTVILAQSVANIGQIELGFDVDSVVTFSMAPESSGYSPEASNQLFDRIEEALATLPGVASVTSSERTLLGAGIRGAGATANGAEGPVQSSIHLHYIGSRFFRTLDMPLLAGRDFSGADVEGAPAVAVVNERFAERFGLGQDVLGQQISVRGTEAMIVGLAGNAKYEAVRSEIQPQVFLPRRQAPDVGSASFYIRSTRPHQGLMSVIRETVARVDPVVPITNLRTLRDQARESVAVERFLAVTSTAFAVLTTVLAALGLYGVLAYSVALRSREIALRFALGAPADRIRRMVLRQSAGMAVAGIVIGAAAAWLLGRTARTFLFGVEAGDPRALAAAAAMVCVVTLASAWVPARRAVRVDPMTALRYE